MTVIEQIAFDPLRRFLTMCNGREKGTQGNISEDTRPKLCLKR